MANPSLHSARLKLARSDHFLTDLRLWQNKWYEDDDVTLPTIELVPEIAEDGREWWAGRLRELPPIPERCGLVVGDAMHNARCALDHLVTALLALNDVCATTQHQFPIYGPSPPNSAQRKTMERNLNGLKSEHADQIKAMQPHLDPKADRSKRLMALAMLDNEDKHRQVHVGAVSLAYLNPGEVGEGIELIPAEPGFLTGERPELFRISEEAPYAVGFSLRPAFAQPSIDLGELIHIQRNAVSIVEGFAPAFGE